MLYVFVWMFIVYVQPLEAFVMRCLRAIGGVTRGDILQHIKFRDDIFTPESIADVIRYSPMVWARLPYSKK